MSASLEYEPHALRRSRRRRVWRAILLAVVLLSLPAVWMGIEAAGPRLHAWRVSRQCEQFQFSTSDPVFDASPEALKAASQPEPERVIASFAQRSSPALNGMPRITNFAVRHPQPWLEMRRLLGILPPIGETNGLIFLHERRTPEGHRVIVALSIMQPGDTAIAVYTIHPATVWKPPQIVLAEFVVGIQASDLAKLKLMPGQPDAANPSKIRVPYNYNGRAGELTFSINSIGYATLDQATGNQFWSPDEDKVP